MNNGMKESLNPAQWAAVQCCDAPSLVIAGAGSGKTRVLTYKIAYLMQHEKVEPWTILALTFTNKAAREMRERIAKLVGEHEASMLWMGTFHSIFYRILRYESEAIGFSSHFTIYDESDSKSLIKNIIKEMGLDDKTYRPGVVANRISAAKNELITPAGYGRDYDLMRRDQASRTPKVHEIYARYQQRLKQSDAMDFDDLLLYTYLLLKEHPEIRQKYEDRFQFVLVDEYQDTNYAQHQIVWLLTEHRQRVSVVGDDAQSIYSFRGARIDNILTFQKMYRDAKLFKLEQNYRSTQTIVGAANSVIHHNQRQIRKDVRSENAVGDPIEVCEAYSDKEEAAIVGKHIRTLMHRGFSLGQMAILYRTNSQSKAFEDEFKRLQLPYRIYGGMSFYQRKEIKDALAYLRLAVNPHDEEALRRVINYPARGIGKTTLDKVFQVAIDHDVAPFEVVLSPVKYALDVNAGTQTKLVRFAQLIRDFAVLVPSEQADTLAIRLLRDSGLVAEINAGKELEDKDRQENLQTLMDDLSNFVADAQEEGRSTLLADYLQSVALLTDQDIRSQSPHNGGLSQDSINNTPPNGGDGGMGRQFSPPNGGDGGGPITLMTVHAAKGLEFPVVFVVGLEENLFPSEMAIEEGNIEEERRLFYVAVTRAAQRLYLTWSHSRMRFGKFENNQRSRFLREVDGQYLKGQTSLSSAPSPHRRDDVSSSLGRVRERSFTTHSGGTNGVGRQSTPSRSETIGTGRQSTPTNGSLRPVRSYQSSFTASSPLPSQQSVSVGQRVEHARFGMGTVVALEGTGLDTKATVDFDNAGRKQLLLRFARFIVK